MMETHDLYNVTKDILIPLGGSIFSFIAILIAIKSLNATNKIARANFELQITLSHRETWQKIGELGLNRIKDPLANSNEITEAEFLHTNFVLHNVKNMFDAMNHGILRNGTRRKLHMLDIGEFFSLPIPNKVWNRLKLYHDVPFQNFVEDSMGMFRNETIVSHHNIPTHIFTKAIRYIHKILVLALNNFRCQFNKWHRKLIDKIENSLKAYKNRFLQ